MKKLVLASLLALGTTTLLAGCGLIPPVSLGKDPLGLDGKTMTVSLATASSPNVSTRTAGAGSAQLNATFLDAKEISIPITPSGIDISMALKNAQISKCVPVNQTVAVTISNFTLALSDGAGPTLRSFNLAIPTVSFNVDTTNGTISGLAVDALKFQITAVQTVINILTTKPEPNTVNVSGDVTTNPPLPGCDITFTVGETSGILKF